MKHLGKIDLPDGSVLIFRFTFTHRVPATLWNPAEPAEWELHELFHERPMEKDHNNVPVASTLTNLHGLIDSIVCADGPFESVYNAIDAFITHAIEEDRK